MDALHEMFAKGKEMGFEPRGISDHHFIKSIYFRDPNGYVIELTAKVPEKTLDEETARRKAKDVLSQWTAEHSA
jgi:catechol-2,3-dioxygenase